MSKIRIIIPEKYKYGSFFHNALEYASENSLNTNELCLELSAYLFEHKNELRNAERSWKYNNDKILEDFKKKVK